MNLVRTSGISKQVYTHTNSFLWVWNSLWVLGFRSYESHLFTYHVQTPLPQTSCWLYFSVRLNYPAFLIRQCTTATVGNCLFSAVSRLPLWLSFISDNWSKGPESEVQQTFNTVVKDECIIIFTSPIPFYDVTLQHKERCLSLNKRISNTIVSLWNTQ